MLHIPLLRHGQVYRSLDVAPVPRVASDHASAEVSLANTGLIRRDVDRIPAARRSLAAMSIAERVAACQRAAEIFLNAELPVGDTVHTVGDYLRATSASTGLPEALVRANMVKIAHVCAEMSTILSGLTRGMDLSMLDEGMGEQGGIPMAFLPTARSLAAVLPSNSPGVHSLWVPALALACPVVLKPGSGDPWTPLRVVQALIAAGLPAEAFGFYPTRHAGGDALVEAHDRAIVFGGPQLARRYAGRADVSVHGPGYAKVWLATDAAPAWAEHLSIITESVARNGGRSCINASTLVVPSAADEIAEALAAALLEVVPRPLADPEAGLAAFADPAVARAIDAAIDAGLQIPGAEDVSLRLRGSPRLVERDGLCFLQPTVIRCTPEHPLAKREYPFPFVAVVAHDGEDVLTWMGPTLVLAAITHDPELRRRALAVDHVDRLHLGAIPTTAIRWDQPHEGNLFEWLYRRRAIAIGA